MIFTLHNNALFSEIFNTVRLKNTIFWASWQIIWRRLQNGQNELKLRITLVVWENSRSQFQHFGVSSSCSFRLLSAFAFLASTSNSSREMAPSSDLFSSFNLSRRRHKRSICSILLFLLFKLFHIPFLIRDKIFKSSNVCGGYFLRRTHLDK